MTRPMPPRCSRVVAGGLTLGLWLWSGPAPAVDTPTEVPTEIPEVPEGLLGDKASRDAERRPLPWRVMAFEDPGDTSCEPLEARYGACLELVVFPDLEEVWTHSERHPREVSTAGT